MRRLKFRRAAAARQFVVLRPVFFGHGLSRLLVVLRPIRNRVLGRTLVGIMQPAFLHSHVDQLHGIEIARERSLGFFVRRTDQPEHEEQSHHGGHEIREGDFPGAAVAAVAVVAHAPDNQQLVGFFFRQNAYSNFAPMRSIQAFSLVSIVVWPAVTETSTNSLGS